MEYIELDIWKLMKKLLKNYWRMIKMSVPTWKRQQSKMEYVINAKNIVKYITERCLKLPKRLTFFMSTKLVDASHKLYIRVLHIQSLYSKTEEHSKKRLELIEESIALLNYLCSMLDVLHIYTEGKMTDKQFETLSNMLEKEIILLKGLK